MTRLFFSLILVAALSALGCDDASPMADDDAGSSSLDSGVGGDDAAAPRDAGPRADAAVADSDAAAPVDASMIADAGAARDASAARDAGSTTTRDAGPRSDAGMCGELGAECVDNSECMTVGVCSVELARCVPGRRPQCSDSLPCEAPYVCVRWQVDPSQGTCLDQRTTEIECSCGPTGTAGHICPS